MGKEKGSILVSALLVLVLLSYMALSLSYGTRQKMSLASRYRDRVISRFLAEGAANEILVSFGNDLLVNDYDHPEEEWMSLFLKETRREGEYAVIIKDEQGKLNINTAGKGTMEGLFRRIGLKDSTVLAEAIISARGGEEKKTFESVYELVNSGLVSPRDLMGEDTNDNVSLDPWEDDGIRNLPDDDADGKLAPGLKDYITVHTDGKVNINTASVELLASMPAITDEVAGEIEARRDETPFKEIEELKDVSGVTENMFAGMKAWAVVSTDVISFSVTAEAKGTGVPRQIKVVADRSGEKMRIISWTEDQN